MSTTIYPASLSCSSIPKECRRSGKQYSRSWSWSWG